jgi:gas vesicle protein
MEDVMAQSDDSGKLTWFLMGVALGAGCALLYAPKSGRETRDMISQKAQGASDTVTGTSRDLYERGKDVYGKGKQVVDDAAALFDRGRKLVRG